MKRKIYLILASQSEKKMFILTGVKTSNLMKFKSWNSTLSLVEIHPSSFQKSNTKTEDFNLSMTHS